jgi:hypothetical protein
VTELINSLKLKKACGIGGIPNECLRHLPRRPLLSAFTLPKSWKEAKAAALRKPGRNPKIPQNFRPISPLPSTGKFFEKVILQIVQKHIEGKNLLNVSQFGFRAHHITAMYEAS